MGKVIQVKVHPHAAGARGGSTAGMPVRVIITDGTVADCSMADYLWADRGYDTDNVIEHASDMKMEAVIPPKKKNRKPQRKYAKTYMRTVIRRKRVS